MARKVVKSKGAGLGPLIPLAEGRKRLEDYVQEPVTPSDPTNHEAICREVRVMLGDTPEEAECGCRGVKE